MKRVKNSHWLLSASILRKLSPHCAKTEDGQMHIEEMSLAVLAEEKLSQDCSEAVKNIYCKKVYIADEWMKLVFYIQKVPSFNSLVYQNKNLS